MSAGSGTNRYATVAQDAQAARDTPKACDIVAIGASLYDIVLDAPEYPREDTKLRFDGQSFHCGGPAATGLVAAAKMGARTAFLGAFSDDAYSAAMIEDFERYGVDISRLVMKPGLVAGSAIVVNSRKTASRTILWTRGTVPPLAPEEVPEDLVAGSRMLYLDGNHIDAAERAAAIAHEAGAKVLLDAGAPYPGIERVLALTDILIASEDFVLKLTGLEDARAAALRMLEIYRPEVFVVTQGEKGGFSVEGGEARRYPCFAPPGPVVSTNAAGDVFHGAFASRYLLGMPLAACLRFASASSAIKVARPGGRLGIPCAAEVEEYLAGAGAGAVAGSGAGSGAGA